MNDATQAAWIDCAVAFASPELQFCMSLRLPAGSTAADALAAARRIRSAEDAGFAESPIPWDNADCGIFGQPCDSNHLLRDGDRVELYRPLQVDPRESRRNRAQAARDGKPGSRR